MSQSSQVVFIGKDERLRERIREACDRFAWQLVLHPGPYVFNDLLKQQLASSHRTLDEQVVERLRPVILELDFEEPGSLEAVRKLKQMDAAMPVIVIGRNPSLAALSVARLDGAEAFFLAPLNNVDCLCDVIEAVRRRRARWIEMLRAAEGGATHPAEGISPRLIRGTPNEPALSPGRKPQFASV